MFIRTKSIYGAKYAYLVESIWNKGKTRQQMKQYLGKVYYGGSTAPLRVERLLEGIKTDEPLLSYSQKTALMEHILSCLLCDLGFTYVDKKFRLDQMLDSGKTLSILVNKKVEFLNKKPACIEVNEGFLCTPTLTAFRKIVAEFENAEKKAQFLADTLLTCGISLERDAFVELFHILSDTEE